VRSSLLALVASISMLGIVGCVDSTDVDGTSTEQLREADGARASSLEATTSSISEADWWWCSTSNVYSRTQAECTQSCPVACRLVTVCVSGTRRVPCP